MYIFYLIKMKSLLSQGELNRLNVKEKKQARRQGHLNINYTDGTFNYKGSVYKILSRRSKYPYTMVKIAKKVYFTNHKTHKVYYKWIKLTGSFVIPCGYSVGTSKTLKIPNGQWREGYKPSCQASYNHTHLTDFIKETSFKGKHNKDVVICEGVRVLSEPPEKIKL